LELLITKVTGPETGHKILEQDKEVLSMVKRPQRRAVSTLLFPVLLSRHTKKAAIRLLFKSNIGAQDRT
jgi:hypothetical protein